MTSAFTIRPATPDDAQEMLDVYSPFCTDTCVSFEIVPPSLEDFRSRMQTVQQKFPWLALEREGKVVGYAYYAEYGSRHAYQWSCIFSIYISADAVGQGNGKLLYAQLLKLAKAQGMYNVYGGITLPNLASVSLHEHFGFTKVSHDEHIGWKHGRWHDVGRWALSLRDFDGTPPTELIPVADVLKAVF